MNSTTCGRRYSIVVEAANVKTLTLNDVRVELNQTTDVPTSDRGLQGETNEVSAGGADSSRQTTTLSLNFNDRQVVELGQTASARFCRASQPLTPVAERRQQRRHRTGEGGSVGGQRPRNTTSS